MYQDFLSIGKLFPRLFHSYHFQSDVKTHSPFTRSGMEE